MSRHSSVLKSRAVLQGLARHSAARPCAMLLIIIVINSLSGCGTPGAPAAPSLQLPDPVRDLRAVRTGDKVTLTWTMPKRSTDKLMLRGPQGARILRATEGGTADTVAQPSFEPAGVATFTDKPPHNLTSGGLRPIAYRVQLQNHVGKSAGNSNIAYSAAGSAPAPLTGLTAKTQSNGVLLQWTAAADDRAPSGESSPTTSIHIHRTLISSTAIPQATRPQAKPDTAPIQNDAAKDDASTRRKSSSYDTYGASELTLIVEAGVAVSALDQDALMNRRYSYTAERVYSFTFGSVASGAQTIEVAGIASAPLEVDTKDVFAPAAPADLAAIAVPGQSAIDLSWTPNTEPDLAGYRVYRRADAGEWTRLSNSMQGDPTQGLAPEFHDSTVVSHHHYTYAVTALDRSGNESTRSAIAEDTLP